MQTPVEPTVAIVDLRDPADVAYWCDRWNVTEEELREAADHAAAPDAPSISFALGIETP